MEPITGAPQQGKSVGAAAEIADAEEGRDLVLDPQDDLGRLVARQMIGTGRGEEMFVDELRRTDRTAQVVNLYESSADTELEREKEDREAREDFKAILRARRNIDALQSPLIEERVDEAVKLWQYQHDNKPGWWLARLADTEGREFGELVRGCKNREARDRVASWAYYRGVQWRTEVGPYKRLVEPQLSDASVIARCGTLDAFDIFDRYKKVIVIGQGASEDGKSFLLNHWQFKGIQWVRSRHKHLRVWCDECTNVGAHGWGLLSNDVLRAALMEEKHGFDFRPIFQTCHAIDEVIRGKLFDAARRVVCYRVGDPDSVRFIAEIMATPRLDPEEVSHYATTTRQFNDGFDEHWTWHTRDVCEGGLWKKKAEGRVQYVPRYVQVTEQIPHYRALADQVRLMEQKICTLKQRERLVRDGRGVRRETVAELENPFLWPEIAEARVNQFLEEIVWMRPEYQPVRVMKPTGRPWVRGGKKSKNGSKRTPA